MANPAFTSSQRESLYQDLIDRAWTAPIQGAFIGGRQPYGPRKFPPSLLSVNSPPAYLPELLILGAEDISSYWRAQRWPQNKTIVSVDNPPPQDDERAAVAEVILNIWNAPIQPLPQVAKKIAATSIVSTTTTADWSSTGASTATFVAIAADTADWSSVAAGTATWVGDSSQTGAFIPKPIFQQHIINAWERFTVLPLWASLLVQEQVASNAAAWISTGASTASFIGDSQSADSPPQFSWKLFSHGSDVSSYYNLQRRFTAATLQQGTTQTADWLSAGVGTTTFVGAAADTAAWSATGASTATWNAASFASAAWNSIGIGTAAFVSNAPVVISADWLASGASTAKFKGPVVTTSAITRDGWKVRAALAEKRRRKDEEEIMAIAKAVLPLLRRGIRQPTRINL